MPTTVVFNVATQQSEEVEITQTEARRLRLGLPVSATEVEINAAWDAFVLAETTARTAEENFALLAQLAKQALRAIDWQQKINQSNAADALLADMLTDITGMEAAGTFAAFKPLLMDYLTKNRTVVNGLKTEAVDNLQRWRKLLQSFSMTSDTTP